MFLRPTAKTPVKHGSQKQRSHQGFSKRKAIADDQLPNPGIESLGLVRNGIASPPGKVCLNELADYRKSTGTAMFLNTTAEQHQAGSLGRSKGDNTSCSERKSPMTDFRIQALEDLGFDEQSHTPGRNRLSELPTIAKSTGTAMSYDLQAKTLLAMWVGTQRSQYRFHLEGKTSYMTNFESIEDLVFNGMLEGSGKIV
jgi:hypothetical protein